MTVEPTPSQDGRVGAVSIQAIAAALGIAGATAITYVLGFVCVNSFLGVYGIFTYSAINAEFLAAGLGFGMFCWTIAIVFIIHPMKQRPSQIWNNASVLLNEYETRNGYAPGFRFGYRFGFMAVPFVKYIFEIGVNLIALLILLYFGALAFRINVQNIAYSPYSWLWIVGVGLGVNLVQDFLMSDAAVKGKMIPLIIIVFWLSAFCYGRGLYPHLPAPIGGVIPERVRFVFDVANKSIMESLLNSKLTSNITSELSLVFETADFFLVDIPDNQSRRMVQIKKDLIKAIMFK